MLLEGKVAVVSGLGPGMGRDISLALATNGADVVMCARSEERMEAVAKEVRDLGREAIVVRCDITDNDDCANVARQAEEQLGHAEILVNNAFHQGDFSLFENADLGAWRTTFDVYFFGSLQLTQALLPLLKASGDGRVIMINTQSVQSVEPLYGAYAASKGALATATQTLARELGKYGIRVNGIHPGYIWGSSVEWYLNHLAEQNGTTFDEEYAKIADQTCLGYITPSSEIAGSVVFFASELSKPVTGQALAVNSGHYLSGP
jgi:NAD(P)-dependent dehydrogenase (short-subunit alcohol dehydrogenase family)